MCLRFLLLVSSNFSITNMLVLYLKKKILIKNVNINAKNQSLALILCINPSVQLLALL